MAEDEKTRQEKADEFLRGGRLVCLQMVGYTAAQISRLGDLAAVPAETIRSLLQQKVELAIARALGQSLQKRRPRIKKTGGKRRRR
jgi:hypothetical protein